METGAGVYEDAKQKIEACGTLLQIENLDLSEELDALKKIKNNARYVTEHLLSASDRFSLSAEGWTKTESGGIRMSGFGYALDATAVYRDTEVTFRLDAPTGAVAVGGVFLRTSLSGNTGLNGYLINYVTDLNYLQVYYFQNCYNTNGSAITLPIHRRLGISRQRDGNALSRGHFGQHPVSDDAGRLREIRFFLGDYRRSHL